MHLNEDSASIRTPDKQETASISSRDKRNLILLEELRQTKERLELAQIAADVVSWEWDLVNNAVYRSANSPKLYGCPDAATMDYAAWWRTIHPDDHYILRDEVQACLAGRREFYAEFRVIWPDGTIRWLLGKGKVYKDTSGVPWKMSGVNIDITEKKQAIESLQASEARLRLALATGKMGEWSFDPRSKRVYWSREQEGVFGLRPGEFEGTIAAFLKRLHPEDVEGVRSRFESAIASESPTYESQYRILRSDGEIRWVASRAAFERGAERQVLKVVGVIVDITDLKNTEESLQRSEEQLRMITNSLPVLMSYVDSGETYRFNNATYEDWFHRPRSFFVGKHIREALGDEAYEVLRPYLRRALAGENVSFESEVSYRDSKKRFVRANYIPDVDELKRVCGIFVLVTDISIQKQIEASLRESEIRFRTLADSMPQIVWSAGTDGRIDYLNQRFFDYTGAKRADFESIEWTRWIHPEDLGSVQRAWADAVQNHGVFEKEMRIGNVRHRSDYRWFLARAVPVRDSDGRVVKWFGTWTEIQHQKQVEGDLREARERLSLSHEVLEAEVARRTEELRSALKEKEVLIKEVHHRVKNNLNVVSSLLGLQSSAIEDPSAKDAFRESQNRIESIALIHESLYRSKDLSRVDFSEYLRSFIRALFHSYGVDWERHPADIQIERVEVSVDVAIPCSLIVNELVSNALKHAFRGREIGKISVRLGSVGGQHVLTVEDDGVSFPESIDFDNSPSLGLQLVTTLTKQIDGVLRLYREGGTKFVLQFPRSK